MKFLASSILLLSISPSSAFDPGFGMPPPGLDPAVVMKLMGSFASCDIDIFGTGMALAAAGGDPSNIDFNTISNLLNGVFEPVDNECTEQDEKTFRSALDGFKTCSGVDLEQVMETWPAASIGEMLHCSSTFLSNAQSILPLMSNDGIIDPEAELPHFKYTERCTEATYGPNPLGDFGRLIWMHPRTVCDCLGSFSKAVPDCTIEEWPVPLVGNWMRKSSCLINSAACPLLEKACEIELNILDQCLPEVVSGKYDCPAVETKCMKSGIEGSAPSLLDFPEEMTGAPMPDICQEVAGHAQFQSKNLVYRYNQHMNECVDKWEGWADDYKHDPIVTTEHQIVAAKSAGGGSGVSAKPIVKQSMGGFIGGMIFTTSIFAGLTFYVYKRNRQVGSSVGNSGYNFMPSASLEMH